MIIEQYAQIEIYQGGGDILATVPPLPCLLRFRRNLSGKLKYIGPSKTYPKAQKLDLLTCDPAVLDAQDFETVWTELEREIQKKWAIDNPPT